MDKRTIKSKLEEALEQLKIHDQSLLEDDVSERCIAHALSIHLAKQFNEFDVDCEYNRHALTDRAVTKEIYTLGLNPEDADQEANRHATPDIIVHKRRTKTNILALELKRCVNRKLGVREFDQQKLKAYTKLHAEEKYNFQYTLGVSIDFYTGANWQRNPIIQWYWDGAEYCFENNEGR